jgi:tight adherence protein B
MIFLTKYIAVIAIGLFVAYLIYLLIESISSSVKQISGQRKKRVFQQESYMKALVKHIEKNPRSKEANYLKIGLALVAAIFVQIMWGKPVFAILGASVVFYFMSKFFSGRSKKQLDKFDSQLIEGIGMITNSVKAGLSILQAIEDMVKNTKPPLSTEFGEALRQIKLGTPAGQALVDITKRIPSSDLRIVIMSINIARDTGGNIAEMLTRLASVMRERKKIQGKIDALTSQGKTSGYIMAGVPFLLMGVLYFLEPEMMGLLFSTFIGNLMLVAAIGMVAVGMFIIGKIVQIDI